LADSIVVLKMVADMSVTINIGADVDKDGKVGLLDALYLLKKKSGNL
jgi:hypothetical protein